jgi:hypothetical protein
MKSSFKTLITLLFASFVFSGLHAQSNQSLVAQARGLAHDCIQPYESDYEVNGFVTFTGTCPDGGQSYRVDFYAAPRCPGNMLCPQFLIAIGSVEYDCEGNATVSCGISPN